jgi:hypothetical protein
LATQKFLTKYVVHKPDSSLFKVKTKLKEKKTGIGFS